MRDVALAGLDTRGIRVRSNRGVAGIDGTVSTAIGAALAYEGAHERTGSPDSPPRTIALIGDLTFVRQLRAVDRADRTDTAVIDHRGV